MQLQSSFGAHCRWLTTLLHLDLYFLLLQDELRFFIQIDGTHSKILVFIHYCVSWMSRCSLYSEIDHAFTNQRIAEDSGAFS